ncbi:MAG TPA: hypothetical protein VIF62_13360 [Labilithrix sp.]|jgi:hypothetical protein
MLPRVCSAGVLAGIAACVPVRVDGMADRLERPHAEDAELVELARVEPAADERALLVVFPRAACSGSARMVFVDARGDFVGAVAPGDAAIVTVRQDVRALVAISSIEITAPVGLFAITDVVPMPRAPSGLLLHTRCAWRGNGQYADSVAATKAELETAIAEATLRWLEPRREEGQAWLDRHRPRVDEILGRHATTASVLLDDRGADDPANGIDAR